MEKGFYDQSGNFIFFSFSYILKNKFFQNYLFYYFFLFSKLILRFNFFGGTPPKKCCNISAEILPKFWNFFEKRK